LSQQYQNLSPETKAALMNTLQQKGINGLSSMSESDARSTFGTLPSNIQSQIQAKWDSLSDEQRIALKKMGPDAIKQMFSSQLQQMVKQSMAPVTQPVAAVVASTQATVQKAQSALQQARATVQQWLAKVRGQTAQPQDQTATTQ
jgi:hypothetical protein